MQHLVAATLIAGLAACGAPPPEAPVDLSVVEDLAVELDLSGVDLTGVDLTSGVLTVSPTNYDFVQKTQTAIADGDPIDLTQAPQGGLYLFIGFQARNVTDPAHVKLTVQVFDGATLLANTTLFPTVVKSPTDPGLFMPDGANYYNVANLGFCPSSSTANAYGRPFTLQITIADGMSAGAPTASATRTVVPSCRQAAMNDRLFCQCTCSSGWMPGKCVMDM